MRRPMSRFALVLLCLSAMVTPALAHPGHPEGTFHDGFNHPLLGLDHLLAMVAVGLLGVRLGGRSLWLMPVSFLSAMLVGGLAAAAGMPLPLVEYGILASVLVLGALIATSVRFPVAAAAALVAAFAFFHGHAHAAEMVAGGSLAPYAGGFLLATASLHALGIGGGLLLARIANSNAVRAAGGAISAATLLLALGLL
ncbi:MAG: HupE/UreJ family protein [Pirellulales bacterium]|nr:HupE/UreJ family protein [Pirellulales bacterium]